MIINLLLSDYTDQEQRVLRDLFRCRPMELQACIKSHFGDRLQEIRKGYYVLR